MKTFAADTARRCRVKAHFEKIYPEQDHDAFTRRALDIFRTGPLPAPGPAPPWSQEDMVLITYGNSIMAPDEMPLKTLYEFLTHRLGDLFSIVHILPFFPYSSDDGFAVMDYNKVNPALGRWEDIREIAERWRLMADLVINHTSSRAYWFENFKKGEHPGKDYYVTADPCCDLSCVIRPRTSPLLREVPTPQGPRHVWCTFSHDQVDLDFKNPEVLFEFLAIIRFYLEQGVRLFRLDAVAFLWKELCTTCLHLAQTHEIIKLFRTLIEVFAPDALIITETNVPSLENISYLGEGDEAHLVYNFPLPPFLVNTMVTGDSRLLVQWLKESPDLAPGTTCLNFIASHDGIGLRPVEGYFSDDQMADLLACMKAFGGRISTRALNDHEANPYEINISLWDAMQGTIEGGPDAHQLARYLCAHAVMLCLKGIPAFYIHSILGTENDVERRANLRSNRAVNRHIWEFDRLTAFLDDPASHHARVFSSLSDLAALRRTQPAFHPDAYQAIHDLGASVVAVERRTRKEAGGENQTLFCLHNITDRETQITLPDLSCPLKQDGVDLLTGTPMEKEGRYLLPAYGFFWISFSD